MKGTHSVGDCGEGAHVIWRQLKVQGLQIGLDMLRLDCLECGADASLQLPVQQHLQRPNMSGVAAQSYLRTCHMSVVNAAQGTV